MERKLDLCRKGKECNVAGLLDSPGQGSLVRRAGSCQAARKDLPPLGNERPDQPNIFVVDKIDLFHAKLADLAPTKVLPAATRSLCTAIS